jgi:hypothetical protein
MRNKKGWPITRSALSIIVLLNLTYVSFSQKNDSTKVVSHFGGAVTVTTKGISTIPNFTLGKPAAIFAMSVGRKISFEPEFRFALEGKPWMFIFWWRYELVKTDKFLTRIGANYSLNFRTIPVTTDGISNERIVAQRSLTADLSPTYFPTKNISIGIYYMYVHGLEEDAVKNIHYIAFRTNFLNIKLSNQFYVRFSPQVYYLRVDEKDGFYISSSLTLVKRNFPVSLSTMITAPIQTNVTVSKSALWNVSLIYTFNKEYVEKQQSF